MNATDKKKKGRKKNRRARLLYIITVAAIYGHKHTNTPVHEECEIGGEVIRTLAENSVPQARIFKKKRQNMVNVTKHENAKNTQCVLPPLGGTSCF